MITFAGTNPYGTHRSLISRGRGGRQAGLKLWRARSRLYQRRFLQPKHHFSAFFKSYKIITPSQRCKFKILRFFQFFRKILRFSKILQNFAEIKLKSVIFHRNLCRILSELLGNLRKLPDVSVYSKKKNVRKLGQAGRFGRLTPPPLRVSRTVIKDLRYFSQNQGARDSEIQALRDAKAFLAGKARDLT